MFPAGSAPGPCSVRPILPNAAMTRLAPAIAAIAILEDGPAWPPILGRWCEIRAGFLDSSAAPGGEVGGGRFFLEVEPGRSERRGVKQRKNHDDASGYQGPTGLRQDGREGTFPVSLSPFSFFSFPSFSLPPRAAYSRPGLAPGLETMATGGRGRAPPPSYPCVQGLPRGLSTRREKALLTFFPFLSSTQFLWGLKASVMKEMVIGATLGLIAGFAWKVSSSRAGHPTSTPIF